MRDRYVPSIPIIIYTHSIYNVNRTILKTLHNLYIYLHMFLNDISSCVSLAITARTRNGCNCNRTLLLITSRILLLLLFLLFNLKTKKRQLKMMIIMVIGGYTRIFITSSSTPSIRQWIFGFIRPLLNHVQPKE